MNGPDKDWGYSNFVLVEAADFSICSAYVASQRREGAGAEDYHRRAVGEDDLKI